MMCIVHKYQFYRISYTIINSLHNFQLLEVLFVVSCAEILYMSILRLELAGTASLKKVKTLKPLY